ncbi:MAG: hypothetical protein ACRDTC_05190 [Pseudonocardiaceae bacterium]
MMSPGVVIFVLGAVFLLIAIIGGGFEAREIKIPAIPGKGRVAAAGAWLVCWVIGLVLLFFPPLEDGRSINSATDPTVTSNLSPPSTPTSSTSSPPLDRAPPAALFPQGAASGGEPFFFLNDPGRAQYTYRVEPDCHRGSQSVGLELRWNMSAAGDPSGGWGVHWDLSPSGSFNSSQFTSLAFSIKGAQGGETFQVGLKDRSGKEVKIESKDRVVITGQDWRWLEIPLADFSDVDPAAVTNVNLGFNKDHGVGQICVDEIAFIG